MLTSTKSQIYLLRMQTEINTTTSINHKMTKIDGTLTLLLSRNNVVLVMDSDSQWAFLPQEPLQDVLTLVPRSAHIRLFVVNFEQPFTGHPVITGVGQF
uniref:Uncharacterized protein n=1 Tax=Romanomermis culicivorax TaxID=13658 RepID=A0A915L6P6_ROMCU